MELTLRFIDPLDTQSLRHRVLWPHLPSVDACVIDIDRRDDAFHVGCFFENQIVSIGSFFCMKSTRLSYARQYRLRAMATDPAFRRIHAGERLIAYAMEELKLRGAEVLWCDARAIAVPFYERIGFSRFEDVYDVPLIGPHFFMWKEL